MLNPSNFCKLCTYFLKLNRIIIFNNNNNNNNNNTYIHTYDKGTYRELQIIMNNSLYNKQTDN